MVAEYVPYVSLLPGFIVAVLRSAEYVTVRGTAEFVLTLAKVRPAGATILASPRVNTVAL